MIGILKQGIRNPVKILLIQKKSAMQNFHKFWVDVQVCENGIMRKTFKNFGPTIIDEKITGVVHTFLWASTAITFLPELQASKVTLTTHKSDQSKNHL